MTAAANSQTNFTRRCELLVEDYNRMCAEYNGRGMKFVGMDVEVLGDDTLVIYVDFEKDEATHIVSVYKALDEHIRLADDGSEVLEDRQVFP